MAMMKVVLQAILLLFSSEVATGFQSPSLVRSLQVSRPVTALSTFRYDPNEALRNYNANKTAPSNDDNLSDISQPTPTSSSASNSKIDELFNKIDFDTGKVDELLKRVDVSVLTKVLDGDGKNGLDFESLKKNLMDGKFGTRGEEYAVGQGLLFAFIIVGAIPFVGDALLILLGPGLVLTGLGILFLGLRDIGNSLSPWPVPPSDGRLVTDGIYGSIRHPMYTGLIATLIGLSVVTGSVTRLLLTGILFYVLNSKVDYEEEQMIKKFGIQYTAYQLEVKGKFFPAGFFDNIPSLDELLETKDKAADNKIN